MTTADTTIRWYTETEVAEHSGMPGPLVATLLPRLPLPRGHYSVCAQVYDSDSIERARLGVLMLRAGIRIKFIRAALREVMSREQILDGITVWTAMVEGSELPATQSTPTWWVRHPALALTAAFMSAAGTLAGGYVIGTLIGT